MSIFSSEEEIPEEVWFFTSGLLSKWGFNDGDLLSWIDHLDGDFDGHAVLCHIVKHHLVPKLNAARVELCEVGGCHNPIRASLINGIAPDHYDPKEARFDWLEPKHITITGAQVLAIAKSLKKVANSN